MERQKVTFPLTYFSSSAQARRKPSIPLDLAPNKQVLPQGRFKIDNKPQANMSGETNRLVNQEGRDSYDDEAAEGATEISQGDDKFVRADGEFVASRTEESAVRARSQRAGNIAGQANDTANERKEEES